MLRVVFVYALWVVYYRRFLVGFDLDATSQLAFVLVRPMTHYQVNASLE